MVFLQFIGIVVLMAVMAGIIVFIISLISGPMGVNVRYSKFSDKTIPHNNLSDFYPSTIKKRKNAYKENEAKFLPIILTCKELFSQDKTKNTFLQNSNEFYLESIIKSNHGQRLLDEWSSLENLYNEDKITLQAFTELRIEIFNLTVLESHYGEGYRYRDYTNLKNNYIG